MVFLLAAIALKVLFIGIICVENRVRDLEKNPSKYLFDNGLYTTLS